MPRVLQLVHGFPPRENAGTERYAAALAEGLRARGWSVHSLAATRMPGATLYRRIEEPGLTRVVNNAPFAGPRRAERDAAMRRLIESFPADIVHVQHPMFLDVGFRHPRLLWTLHDAWAWCAAGGSLFREGGPCPGPGPACVACASAWTRDSPRLGAALGLAGLAARWVDPERLHRAWRRLPRRIRAEADRPGPGLSAADLARRTEAVRAFARACRLLAPSRWLAAEAERQGLGPVEHLPHGVGCISKAEGPGDYFLFLGTIAPHKGPRLVAEAWRRAGVRLPLRIVGPDGPDPRYRLPHEPAVTDPTPLLRRARALVLGSLWPENAPLVILEARAAGCPVIAPDIGGIPELVAPEDGWLYPVGEVEALAACMREAEQRRPAVRPPPLFAAHLDRVEAIYREMLA